MWRVEKSWQEGNHDGLLDLPMSPPRHHVMLCNHADLIACRIEQSKGGEERMEGESYVDACYNTSCTENKQQATDPLGKRESPRKRSTVQKPPVMTGANECP